MNASDVVTAINLFRTTSGCGPVVEDAPLEAKAQAWAESMAADGVMSHGDFAARVASVYPNTAAGEDVAEGQTSVDAVVAAWESDYPHRQIMTGEFDRVGVGIATAADGSIYWCADFDRSVNAPSVP